MAWLWLSNDLVINTHNAGIYFNYTQCLYYEFWAECIVQEYFFLMLKIRQLRGDVNLGESYKCKIMKFLCA